MTYVSGNLMLFYEEGNRRKHISPDVFVVHGVPKRTRLYYMTWEEGKGPDLAIELTSKSTRSEDVKKKMALYRDVLKIAEYFLFDPYQDYLKPSMQGYRLVDGTYEPIAAVDGRLPSVVLGLHLERDGSELRLWDPTAARRVPTPIEKAEAELADQRLRAEAELADQRLRAEAERTADRLRAEAEIAELRRELEELRRGRGPGADG